MTDLVACDVCHGLGWRKDLVDFHEWPSRCVVCDGTGKLSLHAVAKIIGEHPTVLYRLREQRVRQRTAARLFPKLIALSEAHVAFDGAGGLLDA